MSNILSDFLPDAPREAAILTAAIDADVAGKLKVYLAQGMNASVAQGIVASGFIEQTALTQDACQWAVHEIAIALGAPPEEGFPTVPKGDGDPRPGYRQSTEGATVIPAPPPLPPPPVAPAQPQYPVQQLRPARPAILPYQQAVAPAPPRKPRRNAAIIAVTVTAVPIVIIAAIIALISVIPTAPNHAGVIGQVTSVPVRTLTAVGVGRSYPDAFTRIRGQSPLTRDGKPEVLYIGAAFCPYCAANQWPIIVALSRFGTFSGLSNSRSAPSPEQFPNTATLTFDKASYASRYLTFVAVESENVNRHLLQPTTAQESRLWNKYAGGAWPFLDVGNRFWAESLFGPGILQGKTQRQITAVLSNPSSPIAQAVDGSANKVTAVICTVTGNRPTSVCDTATISAIEHGL
jgi:hypothetical protein